MSTIHIVVVGINHRTAPVEIREKFTFSEEDLPLALPLLKQANSILECVIVSTCNRTEIYAVVERLDVCGYHIRSFMETWFRLPQDHFTPYLYIYEDQSAVEHLLHLTTGLDSMIIGETQILGQVRKSLLLAQRQRTTGTLFNTLFKRAITLAKKAHSETSIAENAVSISYAAVELGKRIFGQFQNKSVLIIGAGKMSELTAKHLNANGASKIYVANRTYENAMQLADKFNGEACTLASVPERIKDVDIVISSTGAAELVLDHEQVQSIMQQRQSRPLYMIDIAVPRDLDPEIGKVPNVHLFDIDDLEGIVESNIEQRHVDAIYIKEMIKVERAAFEKWIKTMGVGPLIKKLQDKSTIIHEQTMESLLNRLPDLSEREIKVIQMLSKSMMNQMMQEPIARLKEMASGLDGDEALRMFSQLFALEEQQECLHEIAPPTEIKTSTVKHRKMVTAVMHPEEMMAR